jgi:hypothetical protein
VPFKDKLKGAFVLQKLRVVDINESGPGELKIISGKMSKNEAKVEQGIALKTGHASDSAVSPK